MAFLIDCTMKDYKVLKVTPGVSKKGTAFRSISVFKDGRTAEISCTDSDLFPAVDNLRELDTVSFDVRAVAGRERSYITLSAAPAAVSEIGY